MKLSSSVIVRNIILVVCVLLLGNVWGQDSHAVYNENGLQLQFSLVGNTNIFTDWAEKEIPKIYTVNSIRRGNWIIPIITFATDGKDTNGNANLTYDIKILNPDNSIYGEFKELVIWKDQPADYMHLLEQHIEIRIEGNDPLGTYTIEVVIHEKNMQLDIPLRLAFNVEKEYSEKTALKKIKSIKSGKDFNVFLQEYYLFPRLDLVKSALEYVAKSGMLANESAVPSIISFFSVLFSQHHNMINTWESFAQNDQQLKILIPYIVDGSKNPKAIVSRGPISPSTNDICWGCYFACGDISYIRLLANHLEYYNNRTDINLFMTGASAKWSLSSNARNYENIKEKLNIIKNEVNSDIAKIITDLLLKNPGNIQKEIMEIITEQKEKGIWN